MLKHMEQKNESTPLVTGVYIISITQILNISSLMGHLMMVLYHYLKNMRVKVG